MKLNKMNMNPAFSIGDTFVSLKPIWDVDVTKTLTLADDKVAGFFYRVVEIEHPPVNEPDKEVVYIMAEGDVENSRRIGIEESVLLAGEKFSKYIIKPKNVQKKPGFKEYRKRSLLTAIKFDSFEAFEIIGAHLGFATYMEKYEKAKEDGIIIPKRLINQNLSSGDLILKFGNYLAIASVSDYYPIEASFIEENYEEV